MSGEVPSLFDTVTDRIADRIIAQHDNLQICRYVWGKYTSEDHLCKKRWIRITVTGDRSLSDIEGDSTKFPLDELTVYVSSITKNHQTYGGDSIVIQYLPGVAGYKYSCIESNVCDRFKQFAGYIGHVGQVAWFRTTRKIK